MKPGLFFVQVSGLLGEKDETIRQLELKLSTACNQRERAEARCGEALEENARMRSDLAVLAAQVKEIYRRVLCVICVLFLWPWRRPPLRFFVVFWASTATAVPR